MGDLAITFPLRAAGRMEQPPREIARALAEHLEVNEPRLASVRVDGPGFVNCTFADDYLRQAMRVILDREGWPLHRHGEGRRVLLEFVSANPTGPLHVGHGRGAVYGDVLRRLLEAHGFEVTTEYYVNDAGNQMTRLGESLRLRLREEAGEEVELGEEHYRGDYLRRLARRTPLEADDPVDQLADHAAEELLAGIFEDLEAMDVRFDSTVRERTVAPRSKLDEMIDTLDRHGYVYEEEGAVHLRTTQGDDDKDRVLIRSDGNPTYFANDLLYHRDKYERGFHRLIDVWGHDHHGYRPRLLAGLDFLDLDPDTLQIELYQLVNLYRGGDPLSMSTRQGDFVMLRELVEEVGVDAVRFNFLTRGHNRPLDFDIEVATRQTEENPVYYVQYAHTRLCGEPAAGEDEPLVEEGHRLLLGALDFAHVAASATRAREPHALTHYLRDMARRFHGYYAHHRILDGEHPRRSARRLELVRLLRRMFAEGLKLLGVSAPTSM